jgi:hypothetical protein
VEVESTIRPAKGRIAGFEGREDHRTLFASVLIAASYHAPSFRLRTSRVSLMALGAESPLEHDLGRVSTQFWPTEY